MESVDSCHSTLQRAEFIITLYGALLPLTIFLTPSCTRTDYVSLHLIHLILPTIPKMHFVAILTRVFSSQRHNIHGIIPNNIFWLFLHFLHQMVDVLHLSKKITNPRGKLLAGKNLMYCRPVCSI